MCDNMYDKFHTYLRDLEASFTKLAELLLEKLAALEKFDIDKLDEIIKEEQVFALISKGFDANVQSYMEKLSLRGEKLSDIIKELPAEEQPRFSETFKSLKAALNEAEAMNKRCSSLIEERLCIIDKAMKEIDLVVAPSYGKHAARDAGKPSEGPKLFTKSV